MDGLLIVDKPEGITSADVVRRVKRRLHCKTGHLGTLDPFASGVLPLCLGEGTKVAQFLNAADKDYAGVIRLGSATDSGDPTGMVTETAAIPALTVTQVATVAARFHGEQLQTPPMHSALKRDGTPLYELARRGIEVERAPRRVCIDRLELQPRGDGAIAFAVSCSKGTYVRVLAQEIARALGSVGHLESLRRTRFGPFGIEEATPLDSVERGDGPVLGLRESLRGVREVSLDLLAAQRARRGYTPVLRDIASGQLGEVAKAVGPDGELVAVIVMQRDGWRFARVFADRVQPDLVKRHPCGS